MGFRLLVLHNFAMSTGIYPVCASSGYPVKRSSPRERAPVSPMSGSHFFYPSPQIFNPPRFVLAKVTVTTTSHSVSSSWISHPCESSTVPTCPSATDRRMQLVYPEHMVHSHQFFWSRGLSPLHRRLILGVAVKDWGPSLFCSPFCYELYIL